MFLKYGLYIELETKILYASKLKLFTNSSNGLLDNEKSPIDNIIVIHSIKNHCINENNEGDKLFLGGVLLF